MRRMLRRDHCGPAIWRINNVAFFEMKRDIRPAISERQYVPIEDTDGHFVLERFNWDKPKFAMECLSLEEILKACVPKTNQTAHQSSQRGSRNDRQNLGL